MRSCAWSPDGLRLLSGDGGGNLSVWDARTGEKQLSLRAEESVFSCAWSPDGLRLLSGAGGGNLSVWDVRTGEKQLSLRAEGWVLSCAWSPDGLRLLSGDDERNLSVWDARTGQKLYEVFQRNESQLAWDPATGKITHASGMYWRDFYWESTLPDGSKAQRLIEIFGRPD
jgi:WD40 repeat protein